MDTVALDCNVCSGMGRKLEVHIITDSAYVAAAGMHENNIGGTMPVNNRRASSPPYRYAVLRVHDALQRT